MERTVMDERRTEYPKLLEKLSSIQTEQELTKNNIAHLTDRVTRQHERLEKKITHLDETLHGNGKTGVKEILAVQKTRIVYICSWLLAVSTGILMLAKEHFK